MSRQSGITTGAGLMFIDETTSYQSALPGIILDGTSLAAATGQMDGVAAVAAAGGLLIPGAAEMDGAAAVAATGGLLIAGAARMDGQAQVAGSTIAVTTSAAEMDGAGQMVAAGIMNVFGAAEMDGAGQMVATWPLGAVVSQMDGVGDLEAVGYVPPPTVYSISLADGVIGQQASPAPLLTYHLSLVQNTVTALTTLTAVRFRQVLQDGFSLTDKRTWRWALKLLDTTAVRTSLLTHMSYHYNLVEPIGVRPALLVYWNAILGLVQGIGISQAASEKFIWGRILQDAFKLSSTTGVRGTYQKALAQLLRLSDIGGLNHTIPIALSQAVDLSLSVVSGFSLKLLQKLLAASAASPVLDYHLKLVAEIVVEDIIGHYHFASMLLAELFTIQPALDRQYVAGGVMAELIALAPVLRNTLTLQLVGNLQLSPEQLVRMIYAGDPLLDGVVIQALYISPSGTTTTWAVNTRTNAVTEYLNYDFRSFARMGDRYIAAGSDGLCELDGDTDDGAAIISELMSGYLQLNDRKLFGIKGAYVAIRGNGRFYLKLISGDGRQYVYELRAQPNLMTTKIRIGKGINTTYVAFDLVTEGQDFDLDSVEFIPMIRGRRV